MTHTDGVVTVEIVDCKPEDSGEYKCVATNKHGTDETACVVIVEGKRTTESSFVYFYTNFFPSSVNGSQADTISLEKELETYL